MNEPRTKFWMVYVKDGNTPVFQHSSIELAIQEAKRLVKKHNKPAYVLETVMLATYKEAPITVVQMKAPLSIHGTNDTHTV